MDGNFHQPVHSVIHADWLAVPVFDEISVELRDITLHFNIDVSIAHRALEIVFGDNLLLWVDTDCEVLHHNDIPVLLSSVLAHFDVDSVSS